MDFEKFRPYMTAEMLMGPNSARLLEELLNKNPLRLSEQDILLDLGCGRGLTSFVLSDYTKARIYASDLWISMEENKARFEKFGIGEKVIPYHEDANDMHFEKKSFSALVTVDAYHYFGTAPGFFKEKILPYLKDQAEVLIAVPGIKNEFSGRSEELLTDWLGDEAYMFQSPDDWKKIIGNDERIEKVETWEMEFFDIAWEEWFMTEHEYAIGDKRFFDTLIKPYTCFAGIYVKLR